MSRHAEIFVSGGGIIPKVNRSFLLVTALAAIATGCGAETRCGVGTHRVVDAYGDGTCLPDEDADPDDTADTGAAVDPTVPRDPENPFANCARLVTGASAADGTVWYTYDIEYDAQGDAVIQKKDGNADGSYEENWTYEYNADRTQMTLSYDDDDRNTVVDQRELHTYRSDGNLEMASLDLNADGTYDTRDTYSYDDANRVIRRDDDDGLDGMVEAVFTWIWSETDDGLVSRGAWDDGLDGVIEYIAVETFNAVFVEGSPVGQKIGREVDSDGDGVNEYVYTYEYDSDGLQWAYHVASYDAGVFSLSLRSESVFDAWGRWASSEMVYDDAHSDYDYNITDEYSCW